MELNSHTTFPDVLEKCETYGRIQNFSVAGGIKDGKFVGRASWDDSDLYKALEAASYEYKLHKKPQLRAYMDSVISLLQQAQEEDGYLVTVMRINQEKNLPWNIRAPRFSYLIWSHELYNFGHLYEAAVAHYEATGQTNLLDIATRNADLLVQTFLSSDAPNQWVDGHPEVETGLLKLWRMTGKHAYLLLTQKLLDLRGDSTTHSLYLDYDNGKNPYFFQDYKPIPSFDEAHGHGVRALYLYAAMTDISAYTSGEKYETALKKLWENITNYKCTSRAESVPGTKAKRSVKTTNYPMQRHTTKLVPPLPTCYGTTKCSETPEKENTWMYANGFCTMLSWPDGD